MKRRNLKTFFLSFIALCFISLSGFNFVNHNEGSIQVDATKDSTETKDFQDLIDDYCNARIAKVTKEKELNSLKHQIEQDSIEISKYKLEQQKFLKAIDDIRNKPKVDSILMANDSLKNEFIKKGKMEFVKCDSMIQINEQNISEKIKIRDSLSSLLENLPNEISKKNTKIESCIRYLRRFAAGTHGSLSFNFCGIKYNAFVVNLDSEEIRMHLFYKDKRNFYTLGAVKEYLENKKLDPLMITNAGMFTTSNEPEGLYIETDSKIFYELDTAKRNTDENFYLSPNGVFYVDSNNIAHVETTNNFERIQREGRSKPILATQSGPMLVIDGKLHDKFVAGSRNEKIRSGVGVINGKKVVFAITLNECNFYEFASFFRDVFNCKDALFLDGAISQMYLKNINQNSGGHFGPLISVSKKQ